MRKHKNSANAEFFLWTDIKCKVRMVSITHTITCQQWSIEIPLIIICSAPVGIICMLQSGWHYICLSVLLCPAVRVNIVSLVPSSEVQFRSIYISKILVCLSDCINRISWHRCHIPGQSCNPEVCTVSWRKSSCTESHMKCLVPVPVWHPQPSSSWHISDTVLMIRIRIFAAIVLPIDNQCILHCSDINLSLGVSCSCLYRLHLRNNAADKMPTMTITISISTSVKANLLFAVFLI